MVKGIWIPVLILATRVASADVCELNVTANDQMRFEQQTLEAGAQCTDIKVTLRNAGKLPAGVMGHNWVLTKTADVAAVASAGMSAGIGNNYQKPGDARIVAATKIVAGGETSAVSFSTQKLEPGVSYSFFCSAPGHFSMMKGRFVYAGAGSSSVAKNVKD
jgi:azurin